MPLIRVRFSLGSLLVAIAVVAANCGVLRLFSDIARNAGWRSSWSLALEGSVPLLDVAIIGTVLYAARRLRLLRRGDAPELRAPPAGATFFSLHFVALGAFVTIFMPDGLESYLDAIGSLWGYAEERCVAGFGLAEGTFDNEVAEYLLAFSVSGPLLLLVGIGQVLAKWCAATLPPNRFRALTSLVSLGFAGVAVAIVVTPRPFAAEQDVALDFQVVDKDSGRPIEAAFVRISDPFNSESLPPSVLTDCDGHARLTCRFEVSGERSAFQSIGVFSPWGRWLEIRAGGHQKLRAALPEVLGPFAAPDRLRAQKVALVRGSIDEGSFRDVAGTYISAETTFFGVGRFRILSDGRFAWNPPGMGGCHGGYYYGLQDEYGYLRRRAGEIELLPISQPGRDNHSRMTLKYRTIESGD